MLLKNPFIARVEKSRSGTGANVLSRSKIDVKQHSQKGGKMISKIIFENGREYTCDDCKKSVELFKSRKVALKAGWAVSRDYQKCYCPKCAPFRRNVGHTGERRKIIQQYIDNTTQG